MSEIVWLSGADDLTIATGEVPVVWHLRLDGPETERLAGGATLSAADLQDLASKPEAGMRALRRRLSKLLLARLSGLHPDEIIIGRSALGAPQVLHPEGWHISLAGRFPHCLIGLSRIPIGVDIEPLDAEPPPEDSFTPTERLALQGATEGTLITRWTAKEAHAKCLGIASRIDAAEMETAAFDEGVRVVSREGETHVCVRAEAGTVQAVARLPDSGWR
ncbi:4'-phosphopantetheinyl transferase superfamily protein [Agrobacterium sp. CNPSo 3708]|uniref:4'-phosphopantetheinyl transferase family protein n=1 Tax=unclassified Agrobacterium TaxID=2632611 RepID=UPI002363F859|nr:4'-phosphopantetheinyl transferase superfamily protein [Agrobacterium sp. CNPSo 3708]MDD1499513.1 4'-phosphopantetheinyl transferase superfamily protein [Agrobacterium sp. CNPSo 3708]